MKSVASIFCTKEDKMACDLRKSFWSNDVSSDQEKMHQMTKREGAAFPYVYEVLFVSFCLQKLLKAAGDGNLEECMRLIYSGANVSFA